MCKLRIIFYFGIAFSCLISAAASMALTLGEYTIQQLSNGRFVDAYEHVGADYRLVTRPAQNDDTQRWLVTPLGSDKYRIRQVSTQRYVDAFEDQAHDYRMVTRKLQNNNTQVWIIKDAGGGTYTIQQASNLSYVDAYPFAVNDYRMVMRSRQNNDTQRWIFNPAPEITELSLTDNQLGQWLKVKGEHFSPNSEVSVFYQSPRYGDQHIPVGISTDSNGTFDYNQMDHSTWIECSWYRMQDSSEYSTATLRFEDSEGKTARYKTIQLKPCS